MREPGPVSRADFNRSLANAAVGTVVTCSGLPQQLVTMLAEIAAVPPTTTRDVRLTEARRAFRDWDQNEET